jgi:hypothetical protein
VKSSRSNPRLKRGNPFLTEKRHDPYRARTKLRESTVCPQCGVRYSHGRWTWPKTSTYAVKNELCPACRRINDHYPAGEVVISGSFLDEHRAEVLATIRHLEEGERAQHPLNRIMSIDEHDGTLVVSTTDIHLPHQIGHALRSAWGGTARIHYDLDGYFTRVTWQRDD